MIKQLKIQIVTQWFSKEFLVWLRNFGLFLAAYTIIALVVGYIFAYILPFLIGLFLAMCAQPLIIFLQKRVRLARGKAAALVTFLMLTLAFGFIGWISFLAVSQLISLVQRIPEINPTQILLAIETWASKNAIGLPHLDISFWNQYRDSILSFLNTIMSWFGSIGNWMLSVILSLPIWITVIVVIVFSTFYFSRDYLSVKQNIRFLFSDNAILNLRKTWDNGMSMLGKYIRSYLLIYLLTGIQSFILFSLLKIPYALVWSIIVAIFDIFPIFGPGTIYIPMAGYYLITGDLKTAIFLAIGWAVITIVRQIIEPKIVAHSVEIHPLSMLAILFISFKAGSISIMLYLIFLLVLYNLFKNVNLLKPLFPSKSAGQDPPAV